MYRKTIKRLLDLLFAWLVLVIFMPVMLVIIFAIKLDSRGPAIFSQRRLGQHGKEFDMYKFRTMVLNAEASGVYSDARDSRVTKVGRFLRKTSLDELPQCINILKGDMSFVGPRPERPEIAKEYEKDMPEFALRLQVKAGLTGYAQVYGKYNTPPYDKVQMDLMYVANQSIIEDLKLMLMTFKILFIPSSTEGVSADQTTAKKD